MRVSEGAFVQAHCGSSIVSYSRILSRTKSIDLESGVLQSWHSTRTENIWIHAGAYM